MRYKAIREAITRVSPRLAHMLMYRRAMGEFPNLREPRTFNEKISWLKLYELPNNPLASTVADKLAVREYVAERGCEDILVPLIGTWNRSSSIDFALLPERFALKCSHGCGMNLICSDKNTFDASSAKRKLDEWMETDWALLSAEPHYSSIPHRIVCEEYVEGPLVDYKFFCFHGKPEFYYVSEGFDRGLANAKVSFFNLDGSPAPFKRLDHEELDSIPELKPVFFNEMVRIAEVLSSSFKFARIDYLTNKDRFFFSEITLTPSAGVMPLEPKEWDYKLGEMLVI